MDKKIIKIFRLSVALVFIFFVFYLMFSATDVLAQTQTNNTNISIGCSQYGYPWCQQEAQNPAGLIARFYQIALGLAGACALAVLIYGAILWTVSGAVSTKKDAMDWISAALWGLFLLLAAYLILFTINPDLVNLGSAENLFPSVELKPGTKVNPNQWKCKEGETWNDNINECVDNLDLGPTPTLNLSK